MGIFHPYLVCFWHFLKCADLENALRLAHHGMTEIEGICDNVPYDRMRPFVFVGGIFKPL